MSAWQRIVVFGLSWGSSVAGAAVAAGYGQWSLMTLLALLAVAWVVVWVGQLITERLDEQAATREGARFTGERY